VAKIFLSYQKNDRELAERIALAIRAEGLTVWWDDELTPRESWDRTIEREIATADHVLVLWTRNSVESDWVRIEANYGRNCQPSKLVQARFDHASIPMAFSMIQYVDLKKDDISSQSNWSKLIWWLSSEIVKNNHEITEEKTIYRSLNIGELNREILYRTVTKSGISLEVFALYFIVMIFAVSVITYAATWVFYLFGITILFRGLALWIIGLLSTLLMIVKLIFKSPVVSLYKDRIVISGGDSVKWIDIKYFEIIENAENCIIRINMKNRKSISINSWGSAVEFECVVGIFKERALFLRGEGQ
jgi:hypothetical protein